MSKKKQSRKRKSSNNKVSAMVLDFAREYIAMGEDLEEKQELLNGAVSAWNIACLDENKRKRAITKYIKECRKMNPTYSEKDLQDVEENLSLLIKQKDKFYPDVRIQIVDVIKEINGKDHITVTSMNVE